MRKLKFKLDRKSLEIIYTAFIRPILEYQDLFWDSCAQYEKEELEKLQHEAARIATGSTRLISLYLLLQEIKWDFLQKRRNDHKLSLFFKMKHNLTSTYLSALVPQNVGNTTRYSLLTPTTSKLYTREQLYTLTPFSPLLSGTGIV